MPRVPKKPKAVKGNQGRKVPASPRYTLRKDSLNRRYAIDKRTGKRVSVVKAVKEREQRKKASKLFYGIEPKKKPIKAKRRPSTKKDRSEAAKKGWETRRARGKAPSRPGFTAVKPGFEPFGTLYEQPIIPPEHRMVILGGIADRAQTYPKVEQAASRAWVRIQADTYTRFEQIKRGKTPEPFVAKLFDSKHGMGAGEFIRFNYFARALDIQDIDQIIDRLTEVDDENYSARELYTLYFSPDVA
jgi:hypothetical protein